MTEVGVVGLDLGTSGVRAILYALDGREVFSASRSYPLVTPRPGWAEQNPETIWQSLADVCQDLAKQVAATYNVGAIGLSSILHSFVGLDRDGGAVTPMIIWADQRSIEQVRQLSQSVDSEKYYLRTGCVLHPSYLPGKIRWLREQEPDQFARVSCFGSLKDFLLRRLTGQNVVDRSVANASGLYSIPGGGWDEEILAAIDVNPNQLPTIVEPTDIVGGLTAAAANQLGLPVGTPIVAGAGDGMLSNLGVGGVEPNQMTVTIGTSGAARVTTTQPIFDPKRRTWCYYLARDRWVVGAAINNGGIVCEWTQDNLLPRSATKSDNEIATIEAAAAAAPPGSGGLIFLPFLSGERSPDWNSDARGILFGLASSLSSNHVARSAFEGVCYGMRAAIEPLEEVVGTVSEWRASGGFTRSRFWLQLLSDILGRPLDLPSVSQSSSFGAAGLAMIAIGAHQSLEDIARLVTISPGPRPDPANGPLYTRIFQLYQRIYQANQETFAGVAALQRDLHT